MFSYKKKTLKTEVLWKIINVSKVIVFWIKILFILLESFADEEAHLCGKFYWIITESRFLKMFPYLRTSKSAKSHLQSKFAVSEMDKGPLTSARTLDLCTDEFPTFNCSSSSDYFESF